MFSFLVAALLAAPATQPTKKPRLAVMPLAAKRVPKPIVEVCDVLLVSQIDSFNRYQIITTADMNAVLGLDKMKQVLGCTDLACTAELGGALGVDELISGSVSTLGSKIMVELALIHSKQAVVKKRAHAEGPNNEDSLRAVISEAATKLMGQPTVGGGIRSGTFAVKTYAGTVLYPATFRLTIADGLVTGSSQWTCCPGARTDPLRGTATTDTILLTRDCSGQGITWACQQVYEGRLIGNVVRGSWSMAGKTEGTWEMTLE